MQIVETRKEQKVVKQSSPLDTIIAILHLFSRNGEEEVSLSEFQEAVAIAQQKLPLGYTFSERFTYSLGLLSDLRDLHYRRYIRQYNYRHDAFLPKRFLILTALGKGHGSKVLKTRTDEEIASLEYAVTTAMKNYVERWRLWSRSKSRDQVSKETKKGTAET